MCLFCFYNSANATISPPAVPGYHQLLLGNQVDILGSPLGNHIPIKFGKPCDDCKLLSDHRIITVKTSIPFCHTPHQSMNRSCNAFEPLDFKKADWSGLCSSIKLVNWQVRLHNCIASDCLSVIIETLSDLCSTHVPPKCYKNKCIKVSQRGKNIDEENN